MASRIAPACAASLLLSACAGIYVGVPVGPVQVGTSVDPEGNVGVHAGVLTPAGSVGVSGQVPKEHEVFEEVPAADESGATADGEKGKK